MPAYIDLDLFANIDSTGKIEEHTEGDALKESLRFFVTSKAGDILGFPELGGIMDATLFKTMGGTEFQRIYYTIYTDISEGFSPAIEIQDIDIVPDYQNRILSITIYFTNPITFQLDVVDIYFTLNIPQEKTISYVDIEYTEENLYNFCLTQKANFPTEKLVFKADMGKFVWANFRFSNFTRDDSYFDQILMLINGS